MTKKSPPKTGWNTVKGNVFGFSNNSIGSALHGCCFVGSNWQVFKMNWFNLAKMAWAVKQTQRLRHHNLTMDFVFWLANLTTQNQLNLFWNSCCFIKLNTKKLSFLQLLKKLFQQIFWIMKTFSKDASKECLWILMSRMLWPHKFFRCPEAELLLPNTFV